MEDSENFIENFILSPIQKKILELLAENGPMVRDDLAEIINKPRTTIYDNLVGLMQHDLIQKYSRPTNCRGRPLVFFRLPRAGL